MLKTIGIIVMALSFAGAISIIVVYTKKGIMENFREFSLIRKRGYIDSHEVKEDASTIYHSQMKKKPRRSRAMSSESRAILKEMALEKSKPKIRAKETDFLDEIIEEDSKRIKGGSTGTLESYEEKPMKNVAIDMDLFNGEGENIASTELLEEEGKSLASEKTPLLEAERQEGEDEIDIDATEVLSDVTGVLEETSLDATEILMGNGKENTYD